MQTTIFYHRDQIKEKGDKNDIKNGFNLWINITEPSSTEISDLQKEFGLDLNNIQVIEREAKRPQVRLLENYIFTILLDIRYKTI